MDASNDMNRAKVLLKYAILTTITGIALLYFSESIILGSIGAITLINPIDSYSYSESNAMTLGIVTVSVIAYVTLTTWVGGITIGMCSLCIYGCAVKNQFVKAIIGTIVIGSELCGGLAFYYFPALLENQIEQYGEMFK